MGLTPQQLLDAAQALVERVPTAELVRNQVGNLAVVVDGEYVGWIDLRFGEVHLFADEASVAQ